MILFKYQLTSPTGIHPGVELTTVGMMIVTVSGVVASLQTAMRYAFHLLRCVKILICCKIIAGGREKIFVKSSIF